MLCSLGGFDIYCFRSSRHINPRASTHRRNREGAAAGRSPRAKPLEPNPLSCSGTLGSSGRGAWKQYERRWSHDRNAPQGRRDGETERARKGGDPCTRSGQSVESTLVFAQTVRLRGRAVEWRPRPACEANRGPSPPGKLGAMDHARRGGSTPGFRGSRLATEGCSTAFEGGELAKCPKGCEPFTSGQSVRGCTSAWVVERSLLHGNVEQGRVCCTVTCSKRKKDGLGESEQTRSVRTSTARCPRRAHSGKPGRTSVIGKRRGTLRFARRTESRGGRGGDLVDVPVRCMSHLQKSTGGLGSEKPFPQYVVARKRDGGRGGREPGLRM